MGSLGTCEIGAKRLHLQAVNGSLYWLYCTTLLPVITVNCGGELPMAVLIVLLVSWLVLRGIGALGVPALATWQASARYALAVMFVITASAHFNRMKHDLERMVPRAFPRPMLIIYTTGVLEFLGAAGLLMPRVRSVAGLCLIVLLAAMVSGEHPSGARTPVLARQTVDGTVVAAADADLLYRADLVG